MNFNKAVIVGRLTRDPENRTLSSGKTVTSFSLATNRVWSDQTGNKQEATEYHNIVAFGRLGEICSNYLAKGRLVLVEGRIQTRSWQDQTGNKRYRTEIIADNMQMGPKSAETASRQETKPAPLQEEIPVIEAEEPMEELAESADKENSENKEQIDVKNIPF